jgi:hypothetical protein
VCCASAGADRPECGIYAGPAYVGARPGMKTKLPFNLGISALPAPLSHKKETPAQAHSHGRKAAAALWRCLSSKKRRKKKS